MTIATSLELIGLTGFLSALTFGDPKHPPLLALHGWLDNAASFIPLAGLIKDRYVVALDFTGHGHSAHRPNGTVYHLTDYVADVAHAVRSLGWSQFDLMGHSLGAGVAIAFSAVYSDQVNKLIVIDGLGPITASPDSARERLRKSIDVGLLESTEERLSSAPRQYQSWDKLIDARCLASPIERDSAELLVKRGARETETGLHLNADKRLKQLSPMYLSEDVVLHFIDQIQAPTLAIMAKDSMIIKRSFSPARIKSFHSINVVELAGKHHLHMDTPQPVADEINRFIDD